MVYLRRPGPIDVALAHRNRTAALDGPILVDVTERQLECLAWAGEGKTAVEIGIILGISGRTVEGHLAKVCEALGVRRRIQAAIKAQELGVLPSIRR
jgi:DNA-binding CsgD family transcriptional regulator